MGVKLKKKDLYKLIAKKCDYHLYEVEDVMNALLEVLTEELKNGNQIQFEKLFKFHLEKPAPRYIYNPNTTQYYVSTCHPRLVVIPSEKFKEEIQNEPNIEVFIDRKETGPRRVRKH